MAGKQVPITLVSGFAGAGKTSLIENLRQSLRSRRPAFIFDDGEIDLFAEIEEARSMRGADVIIVECASNLEPYFVAEHIVYGDEVSPPPNGVRLDTIVTVVDASDFIDGVLGSKGLLDYGLAFDDQDDRAVSEVLVEQVEFSDVIVVNKVDLVSEEDLARLESLLERLNPRARLMRATKARVSSDEIIGTGLFDFEETDEGAGWLAELRGEFDEHPRVGNVVSFTFVDRCPFHPIRFNALLSDLQSEGLVRAKGSVWVASRHNEIGVWSLSGRASVLSYGGAWFAATPAREWPHDERERAEILRDWMPPFGDRRQEIAFIGIGVNEAEIRERLSECLLTSNEMIDGPDSWFSIPDPLPDWHVETEF